MNILKFDKFMELLVESPTKEPVRIFGNPDKNPRERVTELLSKKLRTFLQQKHPYIRWHVQVSSGLVSVNFKEIAWLKPQPNKEPPIIDWKVLAAKKLEIDPDEINADFLATLTRARPGAGDDGSDGEEWQSL